MSFQGLTSVTWTTQSASVVSVAIDQSSKASTIYTLHNFTWISRRLIPTFFRMNTGNPPNPNDLANPGGEGLDIDCVAQTRTPGRSEDFLFIPNAETEETPPVRARLFCGQSLNSRSVISSPAGPFSLTFNSDQVYSPADEIGFRMQYEIV